MTQIGQGIREQIAKVGGPSPRHAAPPRPESVAPRVTHAIEPAGGQLRAGERRMLEALARRHPAPLTLPQIGALAGLSWRGGTFTAYLTRLREDGLIAKQGDEFALTERGFAAIGAAPPSAPQSPEEALAMWRHRLPTGTARMLEVLFAAHPNPVTRAELGERSGLSHTGGTFGSALGLLRKLNLAVVDGQRVFAGEALFPRVGSGKT